MTSRRILPSAFLATLTIAALAGCGGGSMDHSDHSGHSAGSSASPTGAADVVTDPTCPAVVSLESVPERVVTMDAGAAAFLIELGLGDTVVGTAAPDFKTDFSGDIRAQLDAVPVLDDGQGSAEAVIASDPDLVTGISQYEFGGFDGTASVDQLESAGSAALSACGAVQDVPVDNIDETYRYISALSDAFDVTERGEELIDRIRTQVSDATAASRDADVPVLSLSSVPDAGAGINTNGGSSLANGIITLAGGTNIARDQLQDFASLSAEAVTEANPAVIVVVSGFADSSDEDLKAAIMASPLLAETDAVKNENVVVVPRRILLSPSLLNADAVQIIADAVANAS